jgi:hypothetical protein
MKAGLKLVLEGVPYRQAAAEVGLASHQDLHREAKKLGLLNIHTKELVEDYKRIAKLSNNELERRLVEEPEGIQTRDLTILSGVSADKAARYENWGHQEAWDPSQLTSSLGQLMDKLASANLKLTARDGTQASITVRRTDSSSCPAGSLEAAEQDDAIDVTPEKVGASSGS